MPTEAQVAEIAGKLTAFGEDALTCASFYEGNRGLVGPETIVDIYRSLNRLTGILNQLLESGGR